MCTSLTLKTRDEHHLLGRTMDFAIDFNQQVRFIPRDFTVSNIIDNSTSKTKYALLGMSALLGNHPVLADGVNEEGLACATLYLPGFADYHKAPIEGKNNIAPYDFVLWSLSNFKTLEEVKDALSNTIIVEAHLSLIGVIPPLHWILSDKSGKSIVVEKTAKGLNIYNNPIGIMTNSPDFEWHLTNLRQYLGVKAMQLPDANWDGLTLSPFSQGSGTFSLPGDFTPPSRFVRAAFLKNNITHKDTEIDGVTALFHILSSCDIPKGAVLKPDGSEDITMYSSAMCLESGTYYYHDYDNRQITAINLFNEDFNSKDIKSYPYRNKQSILKEN